MGERQKNIRYKNLRRCLTLAFFYGCLLNSYGQNVKQIDSLLNRLYSCDKLNGNVLLAARGKIIYQKSFGLANTDTKEPLNENTVFELASLSKQFTATGIMILKERGQLNLDDEISKHLPELSYYKDVTIRQLLHHTSGFPDYLKGMDSTWDKSRIATNNDVITYLSSYHPALLFKPDTKFDYCNTGYVLLAAIIERCSHESYATFLKKNIFFPLKMHRTFVYNRRLFAKKVNNYAYGYQYNERTRKYVLPDSIPETSFVIWLDGIYGDGAVNSTTSDLFKWDHSLYTSRILSQRSINEMFSPATLKNGTQTDYGFGWSLDSTKAFGKTISHLGSWPGYVCYFERDLDLHNTIIVLTNHSNRINYVSCLQQAMNNQPMPALAIYKEIFLPPKQLERFIGTYKDEEGFTITVFLKEGLLFEKLESRELLLTPKSNSSFFIKIFNDTVINFEEDGQGQVTSLHILEGGKEYVLKKVS